jgi:ribosomal protein S18 acetylase RimI-like enzyme
MCRVDIREVRKGDEKQLAFIQTSSWRSAFDTILYKEELDKYTDINKAEEMYTYLLNNNIGNGYILFIDDKPHLIAYWDKSRDIDMDDYAELICIHSLHDNWNKGYGTIMMEYILNKVKENGFKKIYLWVFEENTRARKFYEKQGFIFTDKRKMFCNVFEVMYEKNCD